MSYTSYIKLKGLFFLTLIVFLFSNAGGTNYYLSLSGSDNNSGTSTLSPWQTISKLNTTILFPGDSILFEAGGIFRGEIVISYSGNSVNNIYFGRYGTGENPIISGAEIISGWTFFSGNTYETNFSQAPAHVFADGTQMTIARYPNSGYLQFTQGISDTGFTCTSLTQPDSFWNNANIIMRTANRQWEKNQIKSFGSQSAIFEAASQNPISDNYKFYLNNLLEILDTMNEWYYDNLSQKLFFNAPGNSDPAIIETEGSFYNNGFSILDSASFISIKNIDFNMQVKNGISIAAYSTDINIEYCHFNLQGETGIIVPKGGSNILIANNLFNDINGISISVSDSKNFTISNNEVKRNGLIPGYGLQYYPNNFFAIDLVRSNYFSVSYNSIDSVGGPAIICDLINSSVSKNTISNSVLNLNDMGAIFMYKTHSSTFEKNIVLNTIGNAPSILYSSKNASGFYSEDTVESNVLTGNTIAFATSGISLKGSCRLNQLSGNTIYGCNENMIKFKEGISFESNVGNKIYSNILFGINENSDLINLESEYETFSPAVFDSNYYFNSYNYYISRVITSQTGEDFPKYFNLNLWQKETSYDFHSKETFFYRNRIIATDTTSEDLIPNSYFNNNFDGWVNVHPDSVQMLLDNSTPLDFGCLKLNMLINDPAINSSVIAGNFEIDSTQYYQIGLSSYSVYSGFVVLKFLENGGAYGYYNNPIPFPFNSSRSDYKRVFQPFKNSPASRLNVEMDGTDTTVWLDNITLYRVNAIEENPEKKCRLFINASDLDKTFDLADSIFFDLDQQIVSGSLTLNPYSSAILIFDSSMILNSENIISENEIRVFPNPVQRGTSLQVYLPGSTEENEIRIFDLNGKIIYRKNTSASVTNQMIHIPQTIAQGVYYIQLKQKEKILNGKIVVM